MSSTTASADRLPAPTGLTGRSLAPDLARGVMLLFIAVANAPWYLWGVPKSGFSAHPSDATGLDLVVQSIAMIAIDGRSYPMFAFLFGYGIWQLYSRQIAAGISRDEARRLLRRRHAWMIAFGAVHAILLWMGDIVGGYGLAGLLLVWLFLDRGDRTLRIWAVALVACFASGAFTLLAIGAVLDVMPLPFLAESGAISTSPPESFDPIAQENPLIAAGLRLVFWIVIAPGQGVFGLIVPAAILLAFSAARHRVLEEPQNHLPLLRRTAVGGLAIAWSAGLLVALDSAGVLPIGLITGLGLYLLSSTAGLFGGLGYVAVFALISARIARRAAPGPVVTALQAVGKRSLTFYLFQSVIFAPVMSAWGLGLGAELSSWSIALVALGVWVLSVLIAAVMEARGMRGPAEILLRRLAYPRAPRRETGLTPAPPAP